MAYQINAGNVAIEIAGQFQLLHTGLVLGVGKDLFGADDTGPDNVEIVIDVKQESIQGLHPLTQPRLHFLPVAGRNNAGNQVERYQPVCTLAFTIDIEGNAQALEQYVCLPALFCQYRLLGAEQPLLEQATTGSNLVVLIK